MGPQFFYLQVTATDCDVTCILNGFPVYHARAEGELSNQIPVNVYLIGKNNRLQIALKPHQGKHGRVEASPYLYGAGDVVSTDDEQADRKKFIVETSGEEKNEVFSFDNPRFDFSHVLVEAPVVKDEQSLRTYAAKLLDLIARKDADQLVAEMQPKVRDYATSFSAPPEALAESLRSQLAELLSHPKRLKVSPEEVVFTPYCEGRLWAVSAGQGRSLLYVKDDDSEMALEIVVGRDGDQLKIVR